MHGAGIPFQGIPASISETEAAKQKVAAQVPLRPETRQAFMAAIEGLRAAGATVVFDDSILPDSFADTASRVGTTPYIREGTDNFLKTFGPAQYHSAAEYDKAVGSPLPVTIIGGRGRTASGSPAGPAAAATPENARPADASVAQRILETDLEAEANYFGPRRRALEAYNEVFERLISMDWSIPPSKCRHPTKPCRRMAG